MNLVQNRLNVIKMANAHANVDTMEINAMSVLMHSTRQALSFQSVKAYQVRYLLLSKKSNQRIGSKKNHHKNIWKNVPNLK